MSEMEKRGTWIHFFPLTHHFYGVAVCQYLRNLKNVYKYADGNVKTIS